MPNLFMGMTTEVIKKLMAWGDPYSIFKPTSEDDRAPYLVALALHYELETGVKPSVGLR